MFHFQPTYTGKIGAVVQQFLGISNFPFLSYHIHCERTISYQNYILVIKNALPIIQSNFICSTGDNHCPMEAFALVQINVNNFTDEISSCRTHEMYILTLGHLAE